MAKAVVADHGSAWYGQRVDIALVAAIREGVRLSVNVTEQSSLPLRAIPHRDGIIIEVAADTAAAAKRAADRLATLVKQKPNAVVAFPTGRTPVPLYDELKRRVRDGQLDLTRLVLFQLDEFIGLPPQHPGSFATWLERTFLQPVGIPPEQFYRLPVSADDLATAAQEFEAKIALAGGLDLAVLGLGENGHVAFNEPGSTADSRTRVVRLTEESVQQTQSDWPTDDEVPTMAMTMGIGTLLEARQLLMIVTGSGKARILKRAVVDPPSPQIPATLLRSAGERFVIVADEAAAAQLTSDSGTARRA